ncbi:hypothetical protein LQ564_05570 [Massilia sp. G4R7]|uniref:Uncharacterized protein n=1 Tax=Massilia phyllostachyos TaxID=2898585 RepID=A0ABS8Q222_9BURK|nr:DUF6882 domain-containing protein [Massilia phyllostachyos]MCD2515781.1 hypothetical protein [Massilia phyllostachyos]
MAKSEVGPQHRAVAPYIHKHMFKKILSIFGISALAAPVPAIGQSPIEFIETSKQGLMQQTSAHVATWHLGEEDRWAADLDTGTITFYFKNGTIASASIQIVGTYNTLDGTFLWGWDHPSVPEICATTHDLHSSGVRKTK